MRNIKQVMLAAMSLLAASCGRESAPPLSAAMLAEQTRLLTRLLDAKPGDVITIPEGRFDFDRSLSLRVDGVTLRGAGMDKTVLSFKGQTSGAEGLIVNANDFTLENLAIEDSKGDGLKVNEGKNITIRGVRVEWTGGPKTSNGAYGLYPVQCENVLIEDSVAIGASDAGIYVGQSRNIVLRRNRAERNVAGIEIENSIGADVYENVATENTGGILVFNMPNLPQPGHGTRVYNNRIFANNTGNFGHKGTPVSNVPAGSGVVIYANDKVEVFDNTIADNRTANVLIASYYSGDQSSMRGGQQGVNKDFDPYPEEIYVYGNRFSGGGNSPDGLDLKTLKVAMFGIGGSFPDVVWDGYANAQRTAGPQICIEGASGVLNADNPNKNANPTNDATPFNCTLAKLPAIELKRS